AVPAVLAAWLFLDDIVNDGLCVLERVRGRTNDGVGDRVAKLLARFTRVHGDCRGTQIAVGRKRARLGTGIATDFRRHRKDSTVTGNGGDRRAAAKTARGGHSSSASCQLICG